MDNSLMSQKYIQYIISDMTKMYNIDEQAAKALIKKYGFQKLIAEFPNETFHYQPEYWAKEIFENSTIRLT